VTTVETFDTGLATDGGARGRAIWNAFRDHGSLAAAATKGTASDKDAAKASGMAATSGATRTSVPGATLGACVCQQLMTPLAPGECRQLTFSLSWDVPFARFGSGKALPRR